ncbi:unnamed protein product [Spodoptera littoralis]|uniref:G-protein coupled receptors family 1 profile domain-containing protein n=1 Tax=Spodoptera littoralis TaxID=7109 RepID=A0A9P0HWS2_SPOLI|nr:unnamed protein product [Spodoptera littoralis]CAH1636811.1 unnamed protein product [Spodoptera littoralis]
MAKCFYNSSNLILTNVTEEELAAIDIFHCHAESTIVFALVLCLILIILGIPGNLITVVALAWDKKVRNATALFIINLHISNLMVCIMILPLSASALAQNHWVYGKAMCVAYAYIRFTLATSSILSILAITITRFILVCFPFSYLKIYNRRNISIMILVIWVSALTMYMPYYFGALGGFGLDSNQGFCTIIYEKNGGILYLSFGYVLPILIMIICYFKIWWTATKMKRKMQNLSSCPSNNVTYNSNNTRSALRPIVNRDSSSQGHTDTSDSEETPPSSEANNPGGRNTIAEVFQATFRTAKKTDRVKAPTRKDKKLFTMIIAIIVAYSFMQLPVMINRILILDKPKYPFTMVMLQMVNFAGYCINPIIYVFMSKEYRQAYSKLFRMIMHNLRRIRN